MSGFVESSPIKKGWFHLVPNRYCQGCRSCVCRYTQGRVPFECRLQSSTSIQHMLYGAPPGHSYLQFFCGVLLLCVFVYANLKVYVCNCSSIYSKQDPSTMFALAVTFLKEAVQIVQYTIDIYSFTSGCKSPTAPSRVWSIRCGSL